MSPLKKSFSQDGDKIFVLGTLCKAQKIAEIEVSNIEDKLHEAVRFIRKVYKPYTPSSGKETTVHKHTEVFNFENNAWEKDGKIGNALDSTDNFLDLYGKDETYSEEDFNALFNKAKASYLKENPPANTPNNPEI